MLIVLMLWYGVPIGWNILLTPLVLGVVTIAALGVGCLLSALNVAFRDFKYTIPFLVQIWLFATPSVYMTMGDKPHDAETQRVNNRAARRNAAEPESAADLRPSIRSRRTYCD